MSKVHIVLYCKYVHSVCIAIVTIAISLNIELHRQLIVLLFFKNQWISILTPNVIHSTNYA